MELLKLILSRRQHGWRLTDLAEQSGLGLSTTHRLVQYLLRERLVHLRDHDRHYVAGPALFELGLSLPSSYAHFVEGCGPVLSRICRQTQGVAYVMIRSNGESVCIARKGSLNTKALTIDVGSRRPLVLSAGGLAILIALGKTDMSRALKLNRAAVRQRQRPPGPFEAALRESLRLGFGIYRGPFMPGIQAVGAAAVDSSGRIFGSVSVAVTATDSSLARVRQIADMLRVEAAAIANELARSDLQL